MKKIISLVILLLTLCGCNSEREKVIYKCRQGSSSATYSATFNFVIRSTDETTISSIENSNTYMASFDDTNFDNAISALKIEEEKYKQEYTNTNIDFDIKKEQVFFRVLIPINNHNLLIFKNADSNIVDDGSIKLAKYRDFLEANNYICE